MIDSRFKILYVLLWKFFVEIYVYIEKRYVNFWKFRKISSVLYILIYEKKNDTPHTQYMSNDFHIYFAYHIVSEIYFINNSMRFYVVHICIIIYMIYITLKFYKFYHLKVSYDNLTKRKKTQQICISIKKNDIKDYNNNSILFFKLSYFLQYKNLLNWKLYTYI